MRNIFLLLLLVFSSVVYSQDIEFIIIDASGGANGSINIELLIPGDFDFEWTDENGNPLSPLPFCGPSSCFVGSLLPGRYCVEITNTELECVLNTCFDVQGSNCAKNISPNFSPISDPICLNDDSGFIYLSLAPADVCWNLSGVQYEWSTGSASSSITGVTPGKYCVKVKADPNGGCPECFTYVCGNVPSLEDGPIEVEATLTDPTCDEEDGGISISVSGGASPYSIDWGGNTGTGSSLSNIGEGVYCVMISDVCENVIVECIKLEDDCEDDCEADPILITLTKTNATYCRGELGGILSLPTVKVNISGGLNNQVTVTNQFSGSITPAFGSSGQILTDGNNLWGRTCISVIDECGNEEIECVYVPLVVYLQDPPCKLKKIRSYGFPKYPRNELTEIFQTNSISDLHISFDGTWKWSRGSKFLKSIVLDAVPDMLEIFDIVDLYSGISLYSHVIHKDDYERRNFDSNLLTSKTSSSNELLISPNPLKDEFNITFYSVVESETTLSIQNVNGQLVHNEILKAEEGKNSLKIKLSQLTPGVYYLTVGNVGSKKIIIVNN